MISINFLFFAAILGNFTLTLIMYYLCHKEIVSILKAKREPLDVMYDKLTSRSIISREDISILQNRLLSVENKLDVAIEAINQKESDGK